jgi:DNA-binding transcriptional LysR family regulator
MKQLRHFIAAAQAGNLAKAAETIHLTPSALSISLKNLEEEVNVKLLIRGRGGVQLTYAGELFLKGAHSILKQLDDLQASLLGANDSPAGNVRLGLPFGSNNALAAYLFKSLMQDYPGINLLIEEGNTTNLDRSFENGLFDLMISYDVVDRVDRNSELLYIEHMYFLGPYDETFDSVDEIDSQELEQYPVVLSPGTHSIRATIEQFALNNGIKFNYLTDFQSAHASVKIVQEGLAYTIAPWCLIADHAKTKLISARKIVNPLMERSAYLVSSRDRAPSPATLAIIGVLKAAVEYAIATDKLRAKFMLQTEQD